MVRLIVQDRTLLAGKYIVRPGQPVFAHPFYLGWYPNRLDMGYDGTFKGQIFAPFKGRIVYAGGTNGWNGSQMVVIEAHRSTHPAITSWIPTARLYFTEGCAPLLRTGTHFRAGQPIAKAVNSPYGDSYGHGALGAIEWGVAAIAPDGQQPNTQAKILGAGSPNARRMVLGFNAGCIKYLHMAGATSTNNAGGA